MTAWFKMWTCRLIFLAILATLYVPVIGKYVERWFEADRTKHR